MLTGVQLGPALHVVTPELHAPLAPHLTTHHIFLSNSDRLRTSRNGLDVIDACNCAKVAINFRETRRVAPCQEIGFRDVIDDPLGVGGVPASDDVISARCGKW